MKYEPTVKVLNTPLNPATTICQKRPRSTSSSNHPRLSVLSVRARPGKTTKGLIRFNGLVLPCALGRGGINALKREGDGATPLAVLRPLAIFYRHDRRPAGIGPAKLVVRRVRQDLGWCDLPQDPNYNRPVRLPYGGSHERMMREDRLYDVCVVLDWNFSSRKRNLGSAIFLHIAKPGMEPTEGCIAVTPRAMARLLPLLTRATRILVSR